MAMFSRNPISAMVTAGPKRFCNWRSVKTTNLKAIQGNVRGRHGRQPLRQLLDQGERSPIARLDNSERNETGKYDNDGVACCRVNTKRAANDLC